MDDDGSNKVNPLLQAYADKVLAEYKKKLLNLIKQEIRDLQTQWGYRSETTQGEIDGLETAKVIISNGR